MEFKNLTTLFDFFKDEKTCIEYFEKQRWNGKIVCPHCGYDEKIYRTTRGFKCGSNKCYKKFTVKVGTIFENSNIGLRTWFAAIYIASAHKKGISSYQLSRDLGISQKSAWFVLHRVREILKDKKPELLRNIVEADETYIGGKSVNKHRAERKRLLANGTGAVNKTGVFGLMERGGKVITEVVGKSPTGKVIKPIIRKNLDKFALLITDGHGAYADMGKEYHHEIINHDKNEYGRGIFNTNSIEGFWSLLKRGIIGIYHQVSPKHLSRYADEFSYRYNTRKMKDAERFSFALTHTGGKLSYKTLIDKKG